MVAINAEPWFKVTLTTARLRKPKTRTQPARVQLPGSAKPHLEGKLLKYQDAVIKGWRTMKIQGDSKNKPTKSGMGQYSALGARTAGVMGSTMY